METILFLIVATVAIFAAVMMLITENAVHSALFLIVNFACVAFFYLMLEAPFLAMVQIAVYAGAIMVLFLFVIMLLGAEKTTPQKPNFYWLPAAGVVLAFAFFIVMLAGIFDGQINLQPPAQHDPLLRVVHAATYVDGVDVYLNDTLLAENLQITESSPLTAFPAGDYTLRLTDAGTQNAVYEGPITLTANDTGLQTLVNAVLYGSRTNPPIVAFVPTDLSTVPDNESRVQVFNAYMESTTVSLYDLGLDNRLDTRTDQTVLADLLQGTASRPFVLPSGQVQWAFTDPTNSNERIYSLVDYTLGGDTAPLIVVTGERDSNGTLALDGQVLVRAEATSYDSDATIPFGNPTSIGELLFTRYMLPFQLVALLLLVAMIGAIVLAHRDILKTPRERNVRRRISRPLTSVIAAQTGHEVVVAESADVPVEQPEPAGD
ncbi:MAG: NADH-quinone oxidoreductase subunit J [Anaerolineaceae bacterium]|nr:NADH-quinone oxidoreductase subunit J [Anaerolineaceae bacterium]